MEKCIVIHVVRFVCTTSEGRKEKIYSNRHSHVHLRKRILKKIQNTLHDRLAVKQKILMTLETRSIATPIISLHRNSSTIAIKKKIAAFYEYLLHEFMKFFFFVSVLHRSEKSRFLRKEEPSAEILLGFIPTRGPISNDIRTNEIGVGHLEMFPRQKSRTRAIKSQF